MPQMAPMWWTLISLLTFLMLMFVIMVNYFLYTKKMKMNFSSKNSFYSWKW